MSIIERLKKEFNYIDDKKPNNGSIVIGYCEPIYGKDFEAKLLFVDDEFYHEEKTVRCYYWK